MALRQLLVATFNSLRDDHQFLKEKSSLDFDFFTHVLRSQNDLLTLQNRVKPITVEAYIQYSKTTFFFEKIAIADSKEEALKVADEAINVLVTEKVCLLERAQTAVYLTLSVIHDYDAPILDKKDFETPLPPQQNTNRLITKWPITRLFLIWTGVVVSALIITSIGVVGQLNRTKSYEIITPSEPIEHTYGTPLDLSLFSIKETDYWNNVEITAATPDMIFGFNQYSIGRQEAKFRYLEKEKTFFVDTSFQLSAPIISLQNPLIKWSPIEYASTYEVWINDSHFMSTTKLSIDLIEDVNISGDLNIKVKATSDLDYYLYSPFSTAISTTKIDTVSWIKYEAGIISWSVVPEVESYGLYIGEVYHNVTGTSIAMNLPTEAQQAVVYAYPTQSEHIASKSNPYQLSRLAAVLNLRVVDNVFIWDAVDGAVSYDIYVNGVIVGDNVVTLSQSLNSLSAGIYDVAIIANSNSAVISSSSPTQQSFLINCAISYSNDLLTWSNIPGATSYDILVDEVVLINSINDSFIDLSALNLTAGEHLLKVRVNKMGSSLFSAETQALSLSKLSTPSSLSYDGNTIRWQNSEESLNYEISVDGVTHETSEKSYNTSLANGQHAIKIRSKKSGSNYISSNYYEITFEVGGHLQQPSVSITRHATYTNIWYVNVSPVFSADYYSVTIDKYSDETTFATSEYIFSETTTMNQTSFSDGLLKIVVTVIAKSNHPTVFVDSNPQVVTKYF